MDVAVVADRPDVSRAHGLKHYITLSLIKKKTKLNIVKNRPEEDMWQKAMSYVLIPKSKGTYQLWSRIRIHHGAGESERPPMP